MLLKIWIGHVLRKILTPKIILDFFQSIKSSNLHKKTIIFTQKDFVVDYLKLVTHRKLLFLRYFLQIMQSAAKIFRAFAKVAYFSGLIANFYHFMLLINCIKLKNHEFSNIYLIKPHYIWGFWHELPQVFRLFCRFLPTVFQ